MENVARDGPRPLHKQIRGKMAPIKGRRYSAGSQCLHTGLTCDASRRSIRDAEGAPLALRIASRKELAVLGKNRPRHFEAQRGRYIRQIQGKMAPVKGRRYERLAKSEDPRVDSTRGAPASFSKIPRGVGIPDGSAGNGL